MSLGSDYVKDLFGGEEMIQPDLGSLKLVVTRPADWSMHEITLQLWVFHPMSQDSERLEFRIPIVVVNLVDRSDLVLLDFATRRIQRRVPGKSELEFGEVELGFGKGLSVDWTDGVNHIESQYCNVAELDGDFVLEVEFYTSAFRGPPLERVKQLVTVGCGSA